MEASFDRSHNANLISETLYHATGKEEWLHSKNKEGVWKSKFHSESEAHRIAQLCEEKLNQAGAKADVEVRIARKLDGTCRVVVLSQDPSKVVKVPGKPSQGDAEDIYEIAAREEKRMDAREREMEFTTKEAETALSSGQVGDYIIHKSSNKEDIVVSMLMSRGVIHTKFVKIGDNQYKSGLETFSLQTIRQWAEQKKSES